MDIPMVAASMNLLLLIILAAMVVAVFVFLLAKRQARSGGFSAPVKWINIKLCYGFSVKISPK
jgi:hypothetical protein